MDITAQTMKWISFLKSEYGLNVTVHARDKRLKSLIRRFPQITIHSTTGCVYIKSIPEMWDICIRHQEKIYARIAENGDEPFFGTCYAGIGEYIFPICEEKTVFGFISVGQFRGSDEKMLHAASKYSLGTKTLKKLCEEHLIAPPPDAEQLKTLTAPLCAMILLALQSIPSAATEDPVARQAFTYLHRYFCSDFRLSDVAAYCNCSVRTLSESFRKTTGTTVVKYTENLRMEKAQKLLAETDFRITEIAWFCGYSTSEYFTRRYMTHYGIPPTQERKKHRKCPSSKTFPVSSEKD